MSIKREFFAQEYLLDYSLTTMSPLQIALWNGIVMGGGVGVSCHSKIRIHHIFGSRRPQCGELTFWQMGRFEPHRLEVNLPRRCRRDPQSRRRQSL